MATETLAFGKRVAKSMKLIFLVLLLAFYSPISLAMKPSEVLNDPVLEERARKIYKGLRCVVCQNQSIDDSNANLAIDMRELVRERLLAGDSNADVQDYMVSRYGDFVLLKPPFKTSTYILWFSPLLIIGLGLIALFIFYQRHKIPTTFNSEGLSDEEIKRLDSLFEDEAHK